VLLLQSHHSLVAATKEGLSNSKTLKRFQMQSHFNDAFFTECILKSVNRPLEELVLDGFVFRECMTTLLTCSQLQHLVGSCWLTSS